MFANLYLTEVKFFGGDGRVGRPPVGTPRPHRMENSQDIYYYNIAANKGYAFRSHTINIHSFKTFTTMAFSAEIVAQDKRNESLYFTQVFTANGGIPEGDLTFESWSFAEIEFNGKKNGYPVLVTSTKQPLYASSLFKVKLDKDGKPHTASGSAVEAMKQAAQSVTSNTNEAVMEAIFKAVQGKKVHYSKEYFLTDKGQASVCHIDFKD